MASAVTLQPVAAVFREEQYFDWRVYSLIAILGLVTGIGLLRGRAWSLEVLIGVVIGLGLLMFLIALLLHMTTEVNATDMYVWFGWAPARPRVIQISAVRCVEVVTYRPIADYGCWGIRAGRDGEKAFIARGNRGVRIELTDGTKLLIGSQRPEVLASVLDSALRPGV
jgi:hypothetical protein